VAVRRPLQSHAAVALGNQSGARPPHAKAKPGGITCLAFSCPLRSAGVGPATVPVPDGERLHGYGWCEDQSCWAGSVTIAAAHPLTAELTDAHRNVNVDGFLDQWPQQSTLLLRKTDGAMPVLFTYPLGNGRVDEAVS